MDAHDAMVMDTMDVTAMLRMLWQFFPAPSHPAFMSLRDMAFVGGVGPEFPSCRNFDAFAS